MYKVIISMVILSVCNASCQKETLAQNTPITAVATANFVTAATIYTMPDELQAHEGTWLQWPHHYEYGVTYRDRLDATWVAMTKVLVQSEKVHIIAYNAAEKTRITTLLTNANIALTLIDFKIFQTNDVWVRDNGPIYVKDATGKLNIQDWGFNGWGKKTPFAKDNTIPTQVATAQMLPKIDLNAKMVLEGGAFEIDGNGTFLATKSAILNSNRNPNMTQAQAEVILTQNLGVTNFIWLDGKAGTELTDMHIDGFARFGNANTIVTMNDADLQYWQLPQADINKLNAAKNANGTLYKFIKLPLTKNNVTTAYGKKLSYKGSYVNFYTANNRVLVPNYNDPNDAIANAQIQALFPTKTVVGIDVRNLYENGGMIHCVTQQQPK
jgi:agmatine deiminase